jgi:hypothetical protein
MFNLVQQFQQIWKFSNEQQISSFFFFNKLFGNIMCPISSKYLENEDYGALYRGFPVFWSATTFIFVMIL